MNFFKVTLLIFCVTNSAAYGMDKMDKMDEIEFQRYAEEQIAIENAALEKKKENLERLIVPTLLKQLQLRKKIEKVNSDIKRLDQIKSPSFKNSTAVSKMLKENRKKQLENELEQEIRLNSKKVSNVQEKIDWFTELQENIY